MQKKQAPKSEKLPKIGEPLRSLLMSHLDEFPEYQKSLAKGIRLFTPDELKELKDRYEKGLTWDDIDRELSQKGILLKKATFRKYQQDGCIPRPASYCNTDKGREAVFPPDTISHINFVQYFYKVASGEIVDNLLSMLNDLQITYLESVESQLTRRDNLYASILHYICFNDNEARSAISAGLSSQSEDQQKALSLLDAADDAFKEHVEGKIDALIKFLKERHCLVPVILPDNKEGEE